MLERIRRKTSNALMLYCTIGILIPSCLDGSMDGWMDGWMSYQSLPTTTIRNILRENIEENMLQ